MSKKKPANKKHSRVVLDPDSIILMRLIEEKKYDEVTRVSRVILARLPRHSLALKALGSALIGQKAYEEALGIIDLSFKITPKDPELHNNQGIALSHLMRWDESIKSFEKSLLLEPDSYETLKNMGMAYFRMRRWSDAVPYFLKAIEYFPGDYIDAIKLLAVTLSNANRLDESRICFDQLYKNFPEELGILSQIISLDLKRCDWKDLSEKLNIIREKTENYQKNSLAALNPFGALSFPGINSGEIKSITESFLSQYIPSEFLGPIDNVLFNLSRNTDSRFRIGYLSGDFRSHAVAHVIVDAIENHNKSKVETFAYSLSKSDGSEVRNRLVKAFDHFIDLSSAGYAETARRVREDGIHVLVDLHGWTGEGRTEALAIRCAPVQATWLGFAGTLGHKRLADYLIGDSIVTPAEDAPFYAEEVLNMPHSYMPVDTKILPGQKPSRAEVGLPEKGFIFCSFNNSYKFNPEVFDLWCKILREASGSYLWLSSQSDTVKNNLKNEAQKRGVNPDRLIFASRIEARDEHLARLQLADLALDPFPYNSHSTGVDILWAGVPMVTLKGNTFAGRVGASLLQATGLTDLIAYSTETYFKIAMQLYKSPNLLNQHKQQLTRRTELPLFDMKAFAVGLENLYFSMWETYTSAT